MKLFKRLWWFPYYKKVKLEKHGAPSLSHCLLCHACPCDDETLCPCKENETLKIR